MIHGLEEHVLGCTGSDHRASMSSRQRERSKALNTRFLRSCISGCAEVARVQREQERENARSKQENAEKRWASFAERYHMLAEARGQKEMTHIVGAVHLRSRHVYDKWTRVLLMAKASTNPKEVLFRASTDKMAKAREREVHLFRARRLN